MAEEERKEMAEMMATACDITGPLGDGSKAQRPPSSLLTTMFLSSLAISLLPLAAQAAGVHKLKLHKLPKSEDSNPLLESAYLAEKYGGENQQALFGAGGAGRRFRPANPNNEQLFYTQEQLKGGHNVPLSSTRSLVCCP